MSYKDELAPDTIDLSEYDTEFQRASSQGSRDSYQDEIPDGFYDVRVEDVSLTRVQSTGNPMVVWRLRILGPQLAGRTLTKVRVITHNTAGILKDDLLKLGLEISTLREFNSRIGEMVDRRIGILKRTQPERRWAEVYFVRPRAESAPRQSAPNPTGAGAVELDDDLPF